jgi:hypothetical protein
VGAKVGNQGAQDTAVELDVLLGVAKVGKPGDFQVKVVEVAVDVHIRVAGQVVVDGQLQLGRVVRIQHILVVPHFEGPVHRLLHSVAAAHAVRCSYAVDNAVQSLLYNVRHFLVVCGKVFTFGSSLFSLVLLSEFLFVFPGGLGDGAVILHLFIEKGGSCVHLGLGLQDVVHVDIVLISKVNGLLKTYLFHPFLLGVSHDGGFGTNGAEGNDCNGC